MTGPGMGPVTVVTGAGRGLGRALCVELGARGARVAALGRAMPDLEETARLSGARPFLCDVGDPESVRAAFGELRRALGPVEVLVNNAAVYPRRDLLEETPEGFAAVLLVNLGLAPTLEALGDMAAAGEGRILNVGSFADVAPLPASGAYAVSKGAMRLLARALAVDLGDRFPGIVVSDWMPGAMDTRIGMPEGLAPDRAAAWGAQLALWREPSLNGTLWEHDGEMLPPRGLKGRVADRLLGRARAPRRLG